MMGFKILHEIFQEDMRRSCPDEVRAAVWAEITRRISALEMCKEFKTTIKIQRVVYGMTPKGEVERILMVLAFKQGGEERRDE